MKLHGMVSLPEIVAESRLTGRFNYLTGSDRSKWVTGVPTYGKVRLRDVYPGIDLVLYGNDGRLEFDFDVSPGADSRRIGIDFAGIDGLSITTAGDLLLATGAGTMTVRKPVGLQPAGFGAGKVDVGYQRLGTRRVGLRVRGAEPGAALVIDPVIEYSTFLGGSLSDYATAVAADSSGNAYITGWTQSWDFPSRTTGGCLSTVFGYSACEDAFVVKLDPAGQLVYATFLGGSSPGWDEARGIAVTSGGEVVVTGGTDSTDFPATARFGSMAPKRGAPAEGVPVGSVFITRLRASGGDLAYSVILRGSGDDEVSGLALGPDGSAWVTGLTDSADFPVVAAFQPTRLGRINTFVTRLQPDGSALAFSTYLGGSADDYANGVAVDALGNGYVVGHSTSPDFPLSNAFQTTVGGAFVTKLNPSGGLLYSTYLGGQSDAAYGVTVDPAGSACVVGLTYSPDFPLLHPIQASLGGIGNAFVTKFTPAGDALVFSTFLGGRTTGRAAATSPTGEIVVAGLVGSADFPTVNDWGTARSSGFEDLFVAKMPPTGGGLSFAGYAGVDASQPCCGFAGPQWFVGVATDPAGGVYLAGSTSSASTPVVRAAQPHYGGGGADGFLLKLHDDTVPGYAAAATATPMSAQTGAAIAFAGSASGGTPPYTFDWDFGDGSPHATSASATHAYAAAGAYTVRLAVTDAASHVAWSALVVEATAPPCTLGCAASVPAVAPFGQPVAFSASASPSGCAGSVSYQWAFGDGGTSSEPTPSHTYASPGLYAWSLQATIGSVSCSRSGMIAVASAPVNASYLLPAVAHNPGYLGTQWRSEVAVVNLLASPATAHLTLVFHGTTGSSLFATAEVPAGGSLAWPDILVSLFGQPDQANIQGALLVYADRPVALTVRTYDQTDNGTLGSSYPALVVGDGVGVGQTGVVPGLKRNAGFRSNLGAVNIGDVACTVVVTLYDAQGTQLGTPRTMDLAPGAWSQLNDVLSDTGTIDLAYATVVVPTPNGRAWAYGSVVDNASGDPTTIPMVVP
jgi:PKD repeat protein